MTTFFYSSLVLVITVSSIVTFVLYRIDKRLASRGGPKRIRESTLLIWCLVGGWPGGWIASRIYRHKTRKIRFRIKFIATIVIHLGVTIGVLSIIR